MAPPTKCDLTMEDVGADNGSTRQTAGENRGTATPERSVADFEAHLDVAATCALRVVTELDVVRRCVAPMVGFVHMSCTCVQKDLPIFRSVCGGIVVHKIGATKKAFASTEELFRGWTAISSPTEAYWFVQDFVADVSKQVINADKKRSGGDVIQAAAGAKRPKLVPQVFAVDSGDDDDCVIIETPVRVKSPRYGAVPIAAPSPLCAESGESQTLSLEDLRKARLARFDTE